ncbi:MAG: hypothetical protein ACK56I_10570, partial [bacterium]
HSLDEEDDGLLTSSLSSTLLEVAVGEGERKMLATLAERLDMVDLWSLVCTGIDEGRNHKTQLVLKRKEKIKEKGFLDSNDEHKRLETFEGLNEFSSTLFLKK